MARVQETCTRECLGRQTLAVLDVDRDMQNREKKRKSGNGLVKKKRSNSAGRCKGKREGGGETITKGYKATT